MTLQSNVLAELSTDWTVDFEQAYNFVMPNFVRLFVIRRVLLDVMKYDSELDIDNLVNNLLDADSDKKVAKNILSQLIKDGIKIYMSKYYNENEQANTIDKIFNQIILKKFTKEYENVTRYCDNHNNDNNNFSMIDVFNNNDLMCSIFQFLEHNYYNFTSGTQTFDLLSCSLVNSHWLYHCLNPHSIYHIDLNIMIEKTLNLVLTVHENKFKDENIDDINSHVNTTVSAYEIDNNVTREWQRLGNVKSVSMTTPLDKPLTQLVLNRLSIVKNVRIINACCRIGFLSHIKMLLRNEKEMGAKKIEKFEFGILDYGADYHQNNQDKYIQLSPLKLINAHFIRIDHMHFGHIWSNKCRTLHLDIKARDMKNNYKIIRQWCNNVIKHCDCSGIENLNFTSLTFGLGNMTCTMENLDLLKRIAEKFDNLKHFKIRFWAISPQTMFVTQFWRCLKPIINKNDATVELRLASNFKKQHYQELSQTLNYVNGRIKKIYFYIDNSWCSSKEIIKKMIVNGHDKLGLERIDLMIKGNDFSDFKQDGQDGIELILKLLHAGIKRERNSKDDKADKDDKDNKQEQEKNIVKFRRNIKAIFFRSLPTFTDVKVFEQLFRLLSSAIPSDDITIKQKLENYSLFIKIRFGLNNVKSNTFLVETVFKNVYSWMFDYRFGIHIVLGFRGMDKDLFDKCYSDIYLKYFSQEIIDKKYKKPKNNKYYQSCTQPILIFKLTDDHVWKFMISNVRLLE